VSDLTEEVRTLQDQVESIDDNFSKVKAQNAALTEEISELRLAVVTMRTHLATLIRILAPLSAEPVPVAASDSKEDDAPTTA
jgi:Mg2+ and Co2+ transporter CorA